MATISLKSSYGEVNTIKKIINIGLLEEEKKIKYALSRTKENIGFFEKKYGIISSNFIKKFKNNEIEENSDYFDWWAEYKLLSELEKKLQVIKSIEVCQ